MKKLFFLLFALLALTTADARILKGDVNGGGKVTMADANVADKTPAGVEAVDLGLSVKWASCNVGAAKPEEYGDLFAWGETSKKSTYDWSTYRWCNGSYDTLTKYCTESDYGTVDKRKVLDKEDDAASVNWGGSWRMPTKAEQDELRNNCTWTWKKVKGVRGYKVTSRKNGKSIFLPAAGYRYDSSLYHFGSIGLYWSCSLSEGNSEDACFLFFESGGVRTDDSSRYYGRAVRAVCH